MGSSFHSAVVCVGDFDAAVRDYSLLLGRRPAWTGVEKGSEAQLARFALANMRLELRAATSLVELREGLGGIRLVLAGQSNGDSALAARGISTLKEELEFATDAEGASSTRWTVERVDPSSSRSIRVELVREESEAPDVPSHPEVDPRAAIRGLDHVVVLSADLESTRSFYLDGLGLRLALDRSFEARGVRLLFFRLGGVTIEIGGRLGAEPDASLPDRFGGLAWQVDDVQALQERLAGAGFDVSSVRDGHKPGTRVCSVRDRVHGVPTLLIQPVSRESAPSSKP